MLTLGGGSEAHSATHSGLGETLGAVCDADGGVLGGACSSANSVRRALP